MNPSRIALSFAALMVLTEVAGATETTPACGTRPVADIRAIAEQSVPSLQKFITTAHNLKTPGTDEVLATYWRQEFGAAFDEMVVEQYNLALRYHLGCGVPQDYAQAVLWYRHAAEAGDTEAQNNLGIMYAAGKGVPQDHAQALMWFRKAAEQGDAKAQFNLGFAYQHGEGVPQDDRTAVGWYTKAAEQGNVSAQNNLGVAYERGRGVAQDYIQAHKWFNLAAASATDPEDRERSVKGRDLMSRKLTPEQVAEAQRLAREWKPRREQ